MELTLGEIAAVLATGDTGRQEKINSLLIDSRTLTDASSSLFFAIPTRSNDGHRFIADAYSKGVRFFVAQYVPENMKDATDAIFFIVPDTIGALHKISEVRKEFKGMVAAITGSKGKTTLKEWIFQLMEPFGNIVRSPRSFNSQIGVPLSLWEIRPETDLALIEAGISRKGEMEKLRDIINPDIVIFTNIGDDHAEGFASLEEKAYEKVNLAAGETTGKVIFNTDCHPLAEIIRDRIPSDKLYGWSLHDSDAWLNVNCELKKNGSAQLDYSYKGKKYSITAPLETSADIENAVNALAFMLLSGIEPDDIALRFSALHKIGTRLNVTEAVNNCSLIHDSYTSDFSSLLPALDFMLRRKMPNQKPVLILSDLHHESADADLLYSRIAELIGKAGISRFIGVGENLSKYADLFPEEAQFFNSTSDLLANLSTSDFSDEIILLKGSPEFSFDEIAEMLETRKHETVLEVNLDSIVSNYKYFKRNIPSTTGIVCMVKASGYGAGSYEIAKTLQDAGAAYLAVAVLDEGIDLRAKGITMPVMVMNPKVVNYKSMFAHHLEPEIYSFDMLRDVIREARKNGITSYPIHIKLDTGMHRMGFIRQELPELMDILENSPEVFAKTTFSHLATADCPDMDDYTKLQLDRFAEYTEYMLSRSSHPILRHILNSAGILRFPEYHYDMVRLGIGLYGANTLPPEMEKPLDVVSTLRTVIIAIREWEAGETIGYGRRGELKRKSKIATIPIGYADGMNRHFGRGAISVYINGAFAPTVGNICMDACMIDVTGIECKVGDTVEIFGKNASVQRLADTIDTIPYEILTSVSPRVKRIYYRE